MFGDIRRYGSVQKGVMSFHLSSGMAVKQENSHCLLIYSHALKDIQGRFLRLDSLLVLFDICERISNLVYSYISKVTYYTKLMEILSLTYASVRRYDT